MPAVPRREVSKRRAEKSRSEPLEFAPGALPRAFLLALTGTTLLAAIGLVAAGARPNVWIPAVLLTLAVMFWAMWPSGTFVLDQNGLTKRTPLGRPRSVPWEDTVRVSTRAEWDWPITYIQFRTGSEAYGTWSFAYPGRPWSRQVRAHDSVLLLLALADSPAGGRFDSRSEALASVLRDACSRTGEAGPSAVESRNVEAAYRALLNGRHAKALKLLRREAQASLRIPDDLIRLEYVLKGACADTCQRALADDPWNHLALYYLALSYARPAIASPSSSLGNSERLSDEKRRERMLKAQQLFEELCSSPGYEEVATGWVELLDDKLRRTKTT